MHTERVILCEIDPIVCAVWQYLVHVKPKEILAIPDVDPGGCVDDLHACQEAKWLVGFWLNRATASPRKRPSKWMRDHIRPGSFWGDRVRQTIARQVEGIRHWKIFNRHLHRMSEASLGDVVRRSSIRGRRQALSVRVEQIDYGTLALWCKSRPGQVIVCENEGATWLPFRELADVKTTRAKRRSKEVIWVATNGHGRATPDRHSR